MREDLRRNAIIRVKIGVYKVNGMDFCCREDAENIKNTFDHFGGQNQQFPHYYLIFAYK